jgi:hypothetical protein
MEYRIYFSTGEHVTFTEGLRDHACAYFRSHTRVGDTSRMVVRISRSPHDIGHVEVEAIALYGHGVEDGVEVVADKFDDAVLAIGESL